MAAGYAAAFTAFEPMRQVVVGDGVAAIAIELFAGWAVTGFLLWIVGKIVNRINAWLCTALLLGLPLTFFAMPGLVFIPIVKGFIAFPHPGVGNIGVYIVFF